MLENTNKISDIKKNKTMKNLILTISIIFTMCFSASAQRGSDGFFGGYDGSDDRGTFSNTPATPTKPLGSTENDSAPLGSGLLVLTALGAGYTCKKCFKR